MTEKINHLEKAINKLRNQILLYQPVRDINLRLSLDEAQAILSALQAKEEANFKGYVFLGKNGKPLFQTARVTYHSSCVPFTMTITKREA